MRCASKIHGEPIRPPEYSRRAGEEPLSALLAPVSARLLPRSHPAHRTEHTYAIKKTTRRQGTGGGEAAPPRCDCVGVG